jgi:hypothetical protein
MRPAAVWYARVPQTLKLAIEKSAAVAGVSTNTWLVRCAERAIDGSNCNCCYCRKLRISPAVCIAQQQHHGCAPSALSSSFAAIN